MQVFITPLLSQLRLARRGGAASLRFFTVHALNPKQQEVNRLKVCNFDSNLSQAGVLRVLNSARDNPELASSFLEQLKRNGIPLNVKAYATVVKILSIWKSDIKLDSVLVGLIGNKERSFSVMDLLETIGEQAGEQKRSFLLTRVSTALVKAYVSLRMFDEAIDVLFQINRLGCVPCIKACNFLMNRMIAFGDIDRAVGLFRQLKQFGVCANSYTYGIVVKALCEKGDLEQAAKLLLKFPSTFGYTALIKGFCVNEQTYKAVGLIKDLLDKKGLAGNDLGTACRTVVRGFCNENKIEAAEGVILAMEELGIGPDAQTCSVIIDRHCKNFDLPKAMGFLDKMLEKGLRLNCVIVTSILQCYCKMDRYLVALQKFKEYRDKKIFLDRICYNVAFDALSKLGRVEEAIELLQEMMNKGIEPDVINYTTIIEGYCIQGKYTDALDWAETIIENGTAPDVIMYTILAGQFARYGNVEETLKRYKDMKANGLKPNAATHSVIIEGLCFARKIEEAENLLRSLGNKCPEVDASLVKGYCEAGLSEKAFRRFAGIKKCLSKSVYVKLFNSLCIDGYHDKAHAVMRTMLVYGVKPKKSMYGKLIAARCRLNNVRESQQLFDEMCKEKLIPNLFTYTIMIHVYCRLNMLEKAHDLFEEMEEEKIKPDVVTYTVLIDNHLKSDSRNIKTSSDKVLKDKFSEVLDEFDKSGIGRDVVYYTVLIDRQCKIHNFEAAKELFALMINSGLKPDIVTDTVIRQSHLLANCRQRILHRQGISRM